MWVRSSEPTKYSYSISIDILLLEHQIFEMECLIADGPKCEIQ
jgi:hypothetical protein